MRAKQFAYLACVGALAWAAALAAAEPFPFTEVAKASGLDFVHFNGMTGEHYAPEAVYVGRAGANAGISHFILIVLKLII